ncbi:MAG: GIY-YIG nuclease family protein [Caldilineaceae bacterium]|nr:GIY-YIG nuclease family protein [Caldilineaceae bacterium]MBP8106372.1 GIY-YIG nuclease family protein [Caldilineaceae bacterium]MBP8121445.1 GIY-YIG nuclease family protein [Caldilineaceae bacterium]MBP9073700.1 GIY-YIG nuclease family protein [Caldilineaceae bacterium]
MSPEISSQLTILTDPAQDAPTPGGVYLLRIQIAEPLSVVFGRFRKGAVISLSAGEYVYVGSALVGLGRRLLRHATRLDGSAHPVRPVLVDHFGLTPPSAKRLRWHVDYLLDRPEASLTHIVAIKTERPIESSIAGWLMAHPDTWIPATGLGASDDKGHTHLLGVAFGSSLWQELGVGDWESGRVGE